MTLAAWAETFAEGREEDLVLLEWLRCNLPHLSTDQKRQAVRQLCDEYCYTTRGLAENLGITESAVRHLRATEEQLEQVRARVRKLPRVWGTRVLRLADQWQERASEGLSSSDALALLEELRGLVRRDEA